MPHAALEHPTSVPGTSRVATIAQRHSRADRIAYLDRLKFILVSLIIAGHGVLAYGSLENAWPYQSVQEVSLGAVSDTAVNVVVVPIAMFAMGLFFLLSGLVAPASLSSRGPVAYAKSRLVRLGIPLLVWTLVLWPSAISLAHLAAGESHPPWWQLIHNEPLLDTGPMWFVAVLLIFSLGYCGWRLMRPEIRGRDHTAPITVSTLTKLAIAISLANLLVRPIFPAGGDEFLQIHLWQWPQCLALFGLGIAGAGRGWTAQVPDEIRRRAGFLALLGFFGFVLVALALTATDTDGGIIFEAGLHWPTAVLAVIEGPLAVGASIWLLGVAQKRLSAPPRALGRARARSAYGAFVLQGLVLIGLMIALRPITLSAEAKALLVASLGVTCSFGLSWALVNHSPLRRIL